MRGVMGVVVLAFGLLAGRLPAATAEEVKEIAVAQQFGAIFIPLMAMENMQLIERQARARGMNDLKVSWAKLAGPSVMVDAILSGNLHFSAQGVPSLSLMWDRTRGGGGVGVKAVSAITNTEIYLNTRNPNIKSIRDFTDKDRIAVPSVKVSTQALFLQIAAEKEWGPGQHGKLDHLTVGLAHPDAIAAVLNPMSEITAHFATSPFHEAEMKAGLKTVTSGYQIMGGEVSNLVFVTTEKFRTANPSVYAAVVAALDEAIAWTNADKRRAAKLYMEMSKEKKLSEDDVVAIISAPGFDFTKVPKKTFKFAEFMHHIGALKTKPESWKDLYFPEAHALAGD
jgi:NitT/TauT family transport system substrate-binding protein